jgi:hypothetical protein
MRTLVTLLGLAMLVLLTLHAAPSEARVVDERAMLADIDTFLTDPLGASAELRKAVLAHAETHAEATIAIDEGVAFWFADEKPYAAADIVLLGYIAGSLRTQLETQVWRDDPHSGLLQVARVYRALRTKDAKFVHAGLDQLAKDHADGRLAARAAKLESARAKPADAK